MSDSADREVVVFSAVRRLPGPEYAAYFDHDCVGDAALRERVDELLRANQEAGAFREKQT